jgi:hypothetical protein
VLDPPPVTPYFIWTGRLRAAHDDVGDVAHIFLFSVAT